MAEKGRENVTVSAQQWPLPGNGERPHTPNTFTSDQRAGTITSSQGSYSKHQRRAAAQLEQKKKQKKKWMIILGSVAAVIVVGLGLGLGIGLTVGAKEAEARRLAADNYYSPPVISHTTPENDLMMQMFEWHIPKNASFWVSVTRQLPNLKVLGVKNIWIPPATKNANRESIGYDVYDLWDLGEFNVHGYVPTNMGTKQQLQNLAAAAQKSGVGLIFDAVFNQKSGADAQVTCTAHTLNKTARNTITSADREIQAWLQFDYKERNNKYSDKKFSCDDFTGVEFDAGTGSTELWKIVGQDNAFEDDVSLENDNYDYLLLADLAYRNPTVRADALAWVKWIHQMMPIFGFRLDAAKHLSRGFIRDVLDAMASVNNGADKWFAAEFFTNDLKQMTDYLADLNDRALMFDTLLLTNFAEISDGNKTDMRFLFNNTFLAERPDKAVTFVTTHDTQPDQSLSQLGVEGWFVPIAYATILLRQDGLPCLFFGDMYGTYDDGATAFTFAPKRQMIANMAVARKYWSYGTQKDYFDDKSTVGWTRQGIAGDRPDGLAVVLSNAATMQTLKMDVGTAHAGETWYDITANIIMQTVTIGADGFGTFPVRGESVSVWVNQNAVEGRDSLNQFNADFFHIAPYEIGHATNDYETGGQAQRQVAEGISQYRLDGSS